MSLPDLPSLLPLLLACAIGAMCAALLCALRSRSAAQYWRRRIDEVEAEGRDAVARAEQAQAQVARVSRVLGELTDAQRRANAVRSAKDGVGGTLGSAAIASSAQASNAKALNTPRTKR